MNILQRVNCRMYDWLLLRFDDSLLFHHGDEMRAIFQEEIAYASDHGTFAVLKLWCNLIGDGINVAGPRYLRALGLTLSATVMAAVLTLGMACGFCSLHASTAVHGCERSEDQQSAQLVNASGQSVPLPDGHKMFLECSGDGHHGRTVILATGRGLGSYEAWSLVQQRVASFARVCSFDPLGYGKSDQVAGDHPLDEVVSNMHDLFGAGHLPKPYVLVGASLGGVLIRRYEQQYPSEVAGFVFVDSAHEEMEWRDARIAKNFDTSWDNPKYLQDNGLLAADKRLVWHDDVPTIVLERTDLPPCGAFPGLDQSQCDRINQAWHDMQVDLSKRSKYAELRPIAGSGHAMQQQKPEAISQAVHDVLDRLNATNHGRPLK